MGAVELITCSLCNLHLQFGTMLLGKYFSAVGESVSCLLYYCKVLPLPQRRILFWKKTSCSENNIFGSVSVLNTCIGKTLSKYSLQSLYLNSGQINYHMWQQFVTTSVF